MGKKRLRMFAGPNGSGKSELIKELEEREIPLGPLVNADNIAKNLKNSGFIDLTNYKLKNISQLDWDNAIRSIPELISRMNRIGNTTDIQIKENTLVYKAVNSESYVSALIADFLRQMMVRQGISYSFETVMSHEAKISFLDFAKEKGYTTYLYFIATESPDINIARVENRVAKGGHDVEEKKIKERYFRSLELLLKALKTADRAFLIDNSKKSNFVILEKKYNGMGHPRVDKMPTWFMEYVLKKLESEHETNN
jgi:predicted ABC-type ATPase